MTTTKQSTFGAKLRTTILLASLSGLLVVIGFLIGGASTAALFLGMRPLPFAPDSPRGMRHTLLLVARSAV